MQKGQSSFDSATEPKAARNSLWHAGHTTKEKLKRDAFTFNDSKFNDVLGAVYGEVGRMLAENSDAAEVVAKQLGLTYKKKSEEPEGRF